MVAHRPGQGRRQQTPVDRGQRLVWALTTTSCANDPVLKWAISSSNHPGHLRGLGSTWPDEALFDVALYGVFLNSSLWLYWAYTDVPSPQGVDRLAEALVSLFAPALEGGQPPDGQLARPLQNADPRTFISGF